MSANSAALPPVGASDLVSAGLRAQVRRLAECLERRCAGFAPKFALKLAAAGLNPKQAKALAAVTSGAAVKLLASRRSLADFFEQVHYNGRRLAKLDVPPSRVLKALGDYDRFVAGALRCAPESDRRTLRWAAAQLTFFSVLTLNNAYYEVREREAQAFFALHDAELTAATAHQLLNRYCEILAAFCQAGDAAAALWDNKGRLVAATPGASACPRVPRRPSLLRAGANPSRLLSPAWSGRYGTIWSVPLRTPSVAGILQFAFPGRYPWLPRELGLLTGAAARCGTLLEKSRLADALAGREAQLRVLAAHMIEVEERERRRIGRELHDETGQVLPYVRLQLELLERTVPEDLRLRVEELRGLVERSVVEVRRILAALSPAVLEQLGLGAAIRQFVARLRSQSHIRIRTELNRLGPVPDVVAVIAYRLVQECCSNTLKHASATQLNISLSTADRRLTMRMEDDGVGFRVEDALRKPDSFGLSGMRERVLLAGGAFEVQSRPGAGARVTAILPLERPASLSAECGSTCSRSSSALEMPFGNAVRLN